MCHFALHAYLSLSENRERKTCIFIVRVCEYKAELPTIMHSAGSFLFSVSITPLYP